MDKELRIILTKYFVIVALTIIYIAFMLSFVGPAINHVAFGQEVKAPAPVTPTPVPTPTPTSPNPNPQYLPQKAYIQLFAPENGIPATSGVLPVAPTVVQSAPQQSSGLGIPGLDIAAVLALVGSGAAYVKGHLVGKKTEKVEETTKLNSKHIVEGTTVDSELARLLFEWNKEKADALNNTAPKVKLQALEDNTRDATETATKA